MLKFFIIILLLLILYMLNCFDSFTNTFNIDYYVIHMKDNIIKKENIMINQTKLNHQINIFDAIIGKDIDLNNLQIFDNKLVKNYNYTYPGEIGCYLSHLMLIKSLIGKTNGYTVIFEDDFKIINDNLQDNIQNALTLLNDNFDMLYLGNLNNNHNEQYKDNIYYIDNKKPLWGTHAYVINNKSAGKIYNKLLNMNLEIDNKYKMLFDNHELNGFVIYPNLVVQNNIKSDIR
jgi:glycosyl transferase family 25